jgi:hypothetical protein
MIIGLVGFIGSGKGTVGDLLHTQYGYATDSFARPLKDAVAAIFGWDRDMLEGNTVQSRAWREVPDAFWSEKFGYPFTPRQALQLMGTEAGRNVFHKQVWVISLLQRNQGRDVVVTDVRFKNEVQALHDAGGIIVRVRRGPEPEWYETALNANQGDPVALASMMFSSPLIHSSEWDWIGSNINHTIYNDGRLADLQDNVRHLVENRNVFLTSL